MGLELSLYSAEELALSQMLRTQYLTRTLPAGH